MEQDRILINRNWSFLKTDDARAVMPDYDVSEFKSVTLPHDWQLFNTQTLSAPGDGCQGYFPREEIGVYRYTLFAPEDWRGKDVRILFDGIQRFSEIYLNGEQIGGRKYGYIPILVKLDKLKYGEDNLISVRVDNASCKHMFAGGGDRWYSGAGIYRNVHLLIDEKTHIRHDGVYVNARPVIEGPVNDTDLEGLRVSKADVRLKIEVEGNTDGASVEFEIYDGEKCVYGDKAPAKAENIFEFELEKPILWHINAPHIYTLKACVAKDGKTFDVQTVRFGVRTAVFDNEDGFILNGVKTKLWGLNFHHDGGALGAAVPIEIWRRRFENAKKLGVNAVRTSHNPAAEELYDLCDEMGLMVIDEYCDKWQNSGLYFDLIDDEERLEEIEIMLRRDRNHPSIILWSVGNEVVGQYSEYFFKTLEKLCAKVRSLDSTRAVTCALQGFCVKDFNDATPLGVKMNAVKRYGQIVDVFTGNYMEQFYEKMRECGMRNPVIGSEVFTYYCYSAETLNTVNISGENPYDIVKRHDWVCGSFIWAGCDYLGETGGWPSRSWNGTIMYSTGEPKLRAYFAASHFKTEPVLKLGVYDEEEPWDMARGPWGFPQMRAHWKYNMGEKVLHVAAMTNCDTVKIYQNAQPVRMAHRKDFKDGMVHFYIPFRAGVLRAEGYVNGNLVATDALYSDYSGEKLTFAFDKTELPADGVSVAIADIRLTDAHGAPYVLENPAVTVKLEGDGEILALDNGDALTLRDYSDNTHLSLYNGHMYIVLRAPEKAGSATLRVNVKGYGSRSAKIKFI